jgi:hypothetical protein
MPEPIDLNLIDQIISHIPHWTWPVVKDELIEIIVDSMTSDILERLTGSPTDFDKAEQILHCHYIMPGMERDLLIDSTKILGIDCVVYALDSLKLDTIEQSTDTTPCSIETQ